MRLEKEVEKEAESDAESVQDDDAADHPGLRIQWGWTELNRDLAWSKALRCVC
jgi:hypothetical protein